MPAARVRMLLRVALAALVVLACGARFVHLDADPVFPSWVGYITDEGRWNESARNLALFGHTNAFADRIHLLLSPVYQAVAFIVFKLGGVSLWSARLSSALAGCAIVLMVVLGLRRRVSTAALVLGVVVLGFETNMLMESRMAVPEIPAALGMLACAWLLLLAPPTRRFAALAGAVLVLALGTKGTMALMAPALFGVALLSGEALTWRARWQRLFAFTAGVVATAAVGVAGAMAAGVMAPDKVLTLGDRLLGFISLVPARQLLWDLLESQEQVARNVLLLGVWAGSWLALHAAPGASATTRRLWLATGVWTAWGVLIWAINGYSPARYVVHVIVPATVHLMAALSLADRGTPLRIAARLQSHGPWRRAAALLWLVLPAAVVVASMGVALAAALGWPIARVGVRLGLVVVALVLLAALVQRGGCRAGWVTVMLVAPVAAVVAWYLGWEFGVVEHFWPTQARPASLGWFVVGAVAIAFAMRVAALPVGMLQAALPAVAAVLLVAKGVLPLTTPTFTLRDASRELGRLMPTLTSEPIVVHSAQTLFLDNRLRYRELFRENETFEWLVIFENNSNAQRAMLRIADQPFGRFKSWPIAFDPRFTYELDKEGPVQATLLHRGLTLQAGQPALPLFQAIKAAQRAAAPGGEAR